MSPQRIALGTVEEVLRLYKEVYYDLNIRHFHEKLKAEHGIELSYTWVEQALQGTGWVAKQRRRGRHRRRRERRPLPGMLLHIDGSKHQWLGDQRPLSRFPLRGQAGGTPPLAALGRVNAPAKCKAAWGGLGR